MDQAPHPIRSFFRLEELLHWQELSHYASTEVGSMQFLDIGFNPIGPDHPPDLCAMVATSALGPQACGRCPLRTDPPLTSQPVTRRCVAGVHKTAAAVVVDERAIGYVVGPQIPDVSFYEHDLSRLPEAMRADLQMRKADLLVHEAAPVERWVGRVARRLSRRAILERRLQILRDFRARMVTAHNHEEIKDDVCHALEAILGSVDLCFYVLNERGSLDLVMARGPHENGLPSSLRRDQGHVGRVIRHRVDFYAPDLLLDSAGFVHTPSSQATRSVYTVPMMWGPDEAPGALQVFSSKADGFSLPNRQCVQAIADIAGLAAVRLFLKAQQRLIVSGDLSPGTWPNLLLGLTAAAADDAVQILEAKRQLYDGLAEEACRVAKAPNAHVRIYNPAADVLRFASCVGDGWTDAAKNRIYSGNVTSAGMSVVKSGYPLYVPDTRLEPRFSPTLDTTRSLYVLPFRLRGKIAGVLAVNWRHAEGLEDEYRGRLAAITIQFENVLAVLHTRQESLLNRIEGSLASSVDVKLLVKEAADRIRSVFNARGCSIFLRPSGQDEIRLVATTGPMPDPPPCYSPGEGLTGWVLQNERSVRLKNTADPEELNAIVPAIEPARKWSEDVLYEDAVGHFSFLAAPMMARNGAVGVIRLTIKENLTEFSHEEETLLQEIANRLALTIDRVWRDWEDEACVISLKQQVDLKERITEERTLQGICHVLAEDVMRTTDAVAVHFQIVGDSDPLLRLEIGSGLLRGLNADVPAVGLESSLMPAPLESPLFEEDVTSNEEWRPLRRWLEEQYPEWPAGRIRSAARLPFVLDEHTRLSAILTFAWNTPERFDADRQTLLSELARRAAAALRPSALHRQTRLELDWRVQQLGRFHQIGLRLAHTHVPGELLKEVLDNSIAEARMEVGAIRLLTEDGALVLGAAKESVMPTPAALDSDPAIQRVLTSMHSVTIPDTHNDPTWVEYRQSLTGTSERAYADRIRSTLHVPLRLQGRCIGVLSLYSTKPNVMPLHAPEYLEMLAGYAAVGIDFARMYEPLQREIAIARPLAMMGTMLSGFQHDMRNRINGLYAILGNLADLEPSRIPEKTALIREELARLVRVCSDLAHFSRSDPAALTDKVSLNPLADTALAELAPRDLGQVRVIRNLSKASPTVIGNPVQLEIAVKMLLQNAVEAMPAGGDLTVSTMVSEDGRSTVSIADTGIGMSEATMRRCLEPFFTTKGERGGTGLGLPVVFGIMIRHGGRVDVQSIEHRGSRFTLVFPSEQEWRNGRHSDR